MASAVFELYDWTRRSGDVPGASPLSDWLGQAGARGVAEDDGDVVLSAGGAADTSQTAYADVSLDLPQSSTYTVEVEFLVPDASRLPETFTGAEHIAGAGVFMPGRVGLGFAISQSGIAVVDQARPERVQALPGTDGLVADGSSIVLRAVVSGESATVYWGASGAVYDSARGGDWYETAVFSDRAQVSLGAWPASAESLLWAIARYQGRDVRASAGIPTATTQVVLAVRALRLSAHGRVPADIPVAVISSSQRGGVGSPERFSAAASSNAELYAWDILTMPDGASPVMSSPVYGHVVLNAAADDQLRLIYREPTSRSSDWTVGVVEGDTLRVDCVPSRRLLTIYVVPGSTAMDVLNALTVPGVPGFSEEAWARFSAVAETAGAALAGAMDIAEYTLTPGAASNVMDPTLLVDTPGLYEIGLRVGSVSGTWSAQAVRSFVALPVDQMLGARPDGEFMFAYISDFWRHVRERGKLSDFWSAAIQSVSGAILSLWESEAAANILSATGVRQRRWYRWSMYDTDLAGDVVYFGAADGAVSLSAETLASYSLSTDLDLDVGAVCHVVYSNGQSAVVRVTDTASGGVAAVDPAAPSSFLVDAGNAGLAYTTTSFSDPSMSVHRVDPSTDMVSIDGGEWREIVSVDGSVLTVGGPALLPGSTRMSWEIRRVPTAAAVRQDLGLVLDSTTDVMRGDLVVVDVLFQGASAAVQVPAVVTGARENLVALDGTYLRALVVSAGSPDIAIISLVGVYRQSPVTDDVIIGVPALAPSTVGDAPYVEGTDYTVVDGALRIMPAEGLADVAGDLLTAVSIDFPDDPVGRWVHIGGEALVVEEEVDGSLRMSRAPISQGRLHVTMPRFGPASPPPSVLWSELVLIDALDTVESRHGLLVGLDRGAVTDGNYLTAVRALWVARLKGPVITALEQAVLGMLGIPTIAEFGQIVEVLEPTSTQSGAVLVLHDGGHTTRVPIPPGMRLAVNPRTRSQFVVGDPGSGEEEPGSRVHPGDLLVTGGVIADYISPEGGPVTGPADYHRFAVRVPASLAAGVSSIDVVRDVVASLSPAWTDLTMSLRALLGSDVTVSDTLDNAFALVLNDSLFGVLTGASVTGPSGQWSPTDYADAWPTDENFSESAALELWHGSNNGGYLDDYAGDGAWDPSRAQVLMPNRVDSDIDVSKSLLVVPVTFSSAAGVEFQLYEQVSVGTSGGPEPEWADSPPRVWYVSAAPHPRLPFNIYAPQALHTKGYLVLSFDIYTGSDIIAGRERRLDAIKQMADRLAIPAADVRLIGQLSGAEAVPSVIPDLADDAHHGRYFLLTYAAEVGTASEFALHDRVRLRQTFYVGFGGVLLSDVEAVGPDFDPASSPLLQLETGYGTYDTPLPDNEQLVPSISPGLHTDFDLSLESPDIGGGAATKANTLLRYGWDDVDVAAAPTSIGSFTYDAGQDPLENVHAGHVRMAEPRHHYTHGYVHYDVPAPFPVEASHAAGVLRVEGYHFIAPDPGATNPPDAADPDTYDGSVPGAWVYLYDGSTYYPLTGVVFETGTSAGRTVLGIDGALQTSTGHVLTGNIPAGLPSAVYDVVVVHFYPWQMFAGAAVQVHAEFGYLSNAYSILTASVIPGGGAGTGVLGVDPVGV